MYLVQRIQGGSGTRAPGSAPIRLQGASSLRFQALEQKSRLSGFQNTRFPVGSENVPRQTSFPWNDCWWQSSGVILVHLSKILLLLSPLRAQRRRTQGWSSGLAEPEKSMRPSPGPNIKVGLKLSLEMCSGEAPHSDPDAVMCVGIKHTPVPHLCSGSQRREPPPTPYHQCIGAAPAPGPSSHLPLHCQGVSEGVSKSVSSTWVTLVPGTLKVLNNSSKCSVKYLLNQTTHS